MTEVKKIVGNIFKSGAFGWSIPAVLLAACVAGFGLLIPWLGFYHDDWHFIYYDTIQGTQGMVELFKFDGHPLAVLPYILSFKLVGLNPIAWHIYALIWRWLAVTMFWVLLDKIWPDHKIFSFTSALLFAIYPLFVLQYLPISYFEVWIGYFMFFLSLYLTAQAIQHPQKFWFFTMLAIAAKIGQMFTSEYTWGMEMMRPVMIWCLLPQSLSIQKKIGQTLKVSLPYLAIFFLFGIWRSVFFQAGRKEIVFQSDLLTQPISSMVSWLRYLLPDIGLILVTSWYPILTPTDLDLSSRVNLLIVILILLSSLGIVLFIERLPKPDVEYRIKKNFAWQAMLIGFSGLIFGLVPAYAAGYVVYLSAAPGNTRFALGSIPGAALILTGLMELLISSQKARNYVVAILVGISIGWHVRYTYEFRGLWENQVNFYRQLSWRAPGLKPATAIITIGSIFPKTNYPAAILAISGEYPTALAINTIYDNGNGSKTGSLPYWFFPNSPELLSKPAADGVLHGSHLDKEFTGQTADALVVLYTPNSPKCLHFVRADDANYRGYPAALRAVAPFTSFKAIDTEHNSDYRLLNTIAGPENQNTWCYYYQKADLAAQKKDWQMVQDLWTKSEQKNLSASSGLELLPFTEAFLQSGKWDLAIKLTRAANKLTPNMEDMYCPLWKKLIDEKQAGAEQMKAYAIVSQVLSCP